MSAHARDEFELRFSVDFEGREVTRIDADDLGAEVHRPLKLGRVVRFDKGIESEPPGAAKHQVRRRVVQVPQEKENRVSARGLHVDELCLLGEEALREERANRRGSRSAQVVDRASEALVDENGDGRRARVCELCGEPGGIRVRPQVSG